LLLLEGVISLGKAVEGVLALDRSEYGDVVVELDAVVVGVAEVVLVENVTEEPHGYKIPSILFDEEHVLSKTFPEISLDIRSLYIDTFF
jgi:hypothetical protein